MGVGTSRTTTRLRPPRVDEAMAARLTASRGRCTCPTLIETGARPPPPVTANGALSFGLDPFPQSFYQMQERCLRSA